MLKLSAVVFASFIAEFAHCYNIAVSNSTAKVIQLGDDGQASFLGYRIQISQTNSETA